MNTFLVCDFKVTTQRSFNKIIMSLKVKFRTLLSMQQFVIFFSLLVVKSNVFLVVYLWEILSRC